MSESADEANEVDIVDDAVEISEESADEASEREMLDDVDDLARRVCSMRTTAWKWERASSLRHPVLSRHHQLNHHHLV